MHERVRGRYSGLEFDICGGHAWQYYIILPGESLDARFCGVLLDDADDPSGNYTLDMKIYSVSDYTSENTPNTFGGTHIDAEQLDDCREFTLIIPVDLEFSEMHSALPYGKPLEKRFADCTMRFTRADANLTAAYFEYEFTFDTEEAARANNPVDYNNDSYWLFRPNAAWIRTSFGSIPDDPVQTDDGRWAWRMSDTVYYLFYEPDEVTYQLERLTQDELLTDDGESVLLKFDGDA